MTMPTLIQKYQDRDAVVRLKRAYNILSNAYAHFQLDNNIKNIDTPSTEDGAKNVYEIFKPYLNVAKDCGTTDDKSCAGEVYTTSSYYKVLLNDGTGLIFRGKNSEVINNDNPELSYNFLTPFEIFVDINGPKGPGKWGYDIFELDESGGKIVPCGTPNLVGMPTFEHHCSKKESSHYACAAWVLINENRDYLYCNDLSWDGKRKCK